MLNFLERQADKLVHSKIEKLDNEKLKSVLLEIYHYGKGKLKEAGLFNATAFADVKRVL